MRSAATLVAGFLLAAVAGAAAAAPAPPSGGLVVPGTSFGGLRLGATTNQVESRWGRAYGVCRNCARETWYFNYFAFRPAAIGAEFRGGRAVAFFTLYSPPGWHTRGGLTLGDTIAEVTADYGALTRRACRGYHALLLPRAGALTIFYGFEGRLWAFALQRPGIPVCR